MDQREVMASVRGLADRLANRVPQADLEGLRSMDQAGEWRELVDLLVASLASTGTPITSAEHAELRTIVDAMQMENDSLSRLNVAG